MFEENNEIVASAETTIEEESNQSDYENDSTGEDESSSSEQGGDKPRSETPEQRQSRLKRQIERDAKKAGLSVEEYLGLGGKKSGEEGGKEVDSKYLRLELKTEGLKSTKEQDIVLNYIQEAKLIGKTVDVETALKSLVVREALAEVRRVESVPKPSSRTNGGASDSLDHYARMIKAGKMRLNDVPDAEMRKRLTKAKIF